MTGDRLVELVRDALRSREREPGPRVTERSARAGLYGGAADDRRVAADRPALNETRPSVAAGGAWETDVRCGFYLLTASQP